MNTRHRISVSQNQPNVKFCAIRNYVNEHQQIRFRSKETVRYEPHIVEH